MLQLMLLGVHRRNGSELGHENVRIVARVRVYAALNNGHAREPQC
jgi:hypothetical protein